MSRQVLAARRAGSGTPVVLIHGLGGSADWWRHNVDAIAAEHSVAAIDLPVPDDFEAVAAELAQWIESELGEPVHLAGNSLGGQVAIHLAARRPDLVRSLVLIDSTGVPFAIAPGAHLRNFMVPHGFMSFLRIVARDFVRTGPRAILRGLLRILRDDARPMLRALRMPVLLVWGARDPLVPLEYAKAMLGEMPQARLEVIDRAGHVPMWEQPAAFNRIVLDFFSESRTREFSWGLRGYRDGIAHREAGTARDAVLLHGLGMSSAYFRPLAQALLARGLDAIAPDLPGFGESTNAPAMSMSEQAAVLAKWADSLNIRNATWLGHSLGCNAVAHLAAARPDLVREAVYVGPLWRQTPLRLVAALLADGWREPLALWPLVLRAYWRCGVWRWLGTFRHAVRDIALDPPADGLRMAGVRDPLPNRRAVGPLVEVRGAHGCIFSFPGDVAQWMQSTDGTRSGAASRR